MERPKQGPPKVTKNGNLESRPAPHPNLMHKTLEQNEKSRTALEQIVLVTTLQSPKKQRKKHGKSTTQLLGLLNLSLLNLLLIHIHRRSPRLRTSLSSSRSLVSRATTTRLHTEGMGKRLLRRSRRETGQGCTSRICRFGMSILSGEIIILPINAGGVGLAGALNA